MNTPTPANDIRPLHEFERCLEPEPVSLSDVLIGIGWAVCDLIAENWLAVALGFLLGLGVTVGLASVIGAIL